MGCVKVSAVDPTADDGTLRLLKSPADVVLAWFSRFEPKPAIALASELDWRCRAHRLRVMRQVRYSTKTEDSLGLVLFLHGIS